MGVFARLFRRSNTTEEASAAGTPAAGTPESGPAAEENAAEAAVTSDAGPRNTTRPAEADEATDAADSADSADADSVGIPKQQSAGEAVDNEADKGART
ncbi:hypothetical protein [Streptomyces sp. WG5]|uniref:hypothetical protein n=1 Tax=Streptomyces sp. WG5 TaxID=3417648 RepID=UPI003CEC1880